MMKFHPKLIVKMLVVFRSMSGLRDSEMAVGCWQPAFLPDNSTGEVHNFRMSLWAEHFGSVDSAFKYPGSTECVLKVQSLADQNWKDYADGSSEPEGFAMTYPLNVDSDGTVGTLEGFEEFPDFPQGSKIIGKKSIEFAGQLRLLTT